MNRIMRLIGFIIASLSLFISSLLAETPVLRFHKNGTFKIAQFTDLHLAYENKASAITFERIDQVVADEKPDLIILTGDIIYSKPGKENFQSILTFLEKKQIPFAFVFGNHDDEQGLSREELFALGKPYAYNMSTDLFPELSGVGNYVLNIRSSEGEATAFALYCLDSNAYSQIEGIKGYDYIKPDQIHWYQAQSKQLTEQNNGKPLPALAFFHIPVPEYATAVSANNAQVYGIKRENVCAPELNSGLFLAFKECGDVMGTFVGHDHNNDYAAYWHGILLAYGRYTGGSTVYNDLPNGGRIIELKEGQRSFSTWIRTAQGVEQVVTYPDSFVKK